ncbi:MAG: proteasome subunit beta [Candidatus Woesearchaeota archaeon]|nr:MAG: proteasome subunit beta [Candidatus Woesearchaeota archaeon]
MDEIKDKILKTGTTTVGIKCKDGVVLAGDMQVTQGMMLVGDKDFEKVIPINDYHAVTIAGSVSDVQLILKLIKAQVKLEELRRGKKLGSKEIANLLGGLNYNAIRSYSTIPSIAGFLMAGYDGAFHLYEIEPAGAIIEEKRYKADGSGLMMAYGVLEANYKDGMSLDEGVKLAVKAINAAIQRDTSTGYGINVFTVTEKGVKKVLSKEIDMTIKA